MQIVHAGEMDWGENLAAHRSGGMAHKVLFEGQEGSPDNFVLVMAREGSDYYSPRHRHAWDQVRMCLQGSVPLGGPLRLDAGEVAYFPEGVAYGPHEGGPDRLVLLLQFGGAGGLGYLSARQMRQARADLADEGVFEGGVFKRTAGEGPKNQDAYEAIWRHVTGRPIDYPKPRYKAPIVMRPEGFSWVAADGFDGVRRRRLGDFAERGLKLEIVHLDPAAIWRLGREGVRRFVFVTEGAGLCESDAFTDHTAVMLEPGDSAAFRAADAATLLVISVADVGALSPSLPPG
jgi:hypothetical protein